MMHEYSELIRTTIENNNHGVIIEISQPLQAKVRSYSGEKSTAIDTSWASSAIFDTFTTCIE